MNARTQPLGSLHFPLGSIFFPSLPSFSPSFSYLHSLSSTDGVYPSDIL